MTSASGATTCGCGSSSTRCAQIFCPRPFGYKASGSLWFRFPRPFGHSASGPLWFAVSCSAEARPDPCCPPRRSQFLRWVRSPQVFDCLPFSAIVEEKILCVHAGLSPELQSLEQLRKIPRPTEIPDAGTIPPPRARPAPPPASAPLCSADDCVVVATAGGSDALHRFTVSWWRRCVGARE